MYVIQERALFLMFSPSQISFTVAHLYCHLIRELWESEHRLHPCHTGSLWLFLKFIWLVRKSCGLPPHKSEAEIQGNSLIPSYGFSVVSLSHTALSPWNLYVFYLAQYELCYVNFSLGITFNSVRYDHILFRKLSVLGTSPHCWHHHLPFKNFLSRCPLSRSVMTYRAWA